MMRFNKTDIIYIFAYGILTLLHVAFQASDEFASFYSFHIQMLDISLMYILSMLIWLFPKFLLIIYGIQLFVSMYESSFIYFKIRNINHWNWSSFVIKRIGMKFLLAELFKAIILAGLFFQFNLVYLLLDFLWIFIWFFLYIDIYLLVTKNRTILYTSIIFMIINIGLLYLHDLNVSSLYYLNDTTVGAAGAYIALFIIVIVIFHIVLSRKTE